MSGSQNFYIPAEVQNPPNCRECGHRLHDGWEGQKHRIGSHHYRTWTAEDGKRQAADAIAKAKARALPDANEKEPA